MNLKKALPTQEQLTAMLTLQASMNAKVNPDWMSAGYPFLRAVVIEGAEAIEHHGWKWWKRQEKDLPQLQMELVDIWHFVLSNFVIQHGGNLEGAAEEILVDLQSGSSAVEFDSKFYEIAKLDTVSKLELMLGLAVARRVSVPLFNALLQDCDMRWEDLLKQYVGKNVLNFFRQDNGYKAGTYLKTWGGREDNEHLSEILEGMDVAHPDMAQQLYVILETRYLSFSS